MFFLTFISVFSLIVYLVRFNTNNKFHFLTYVLTRVLNLTTYDSTTINNKDKIILNKKKCYSLLNFVTFKEL